MNENKMPLELTTEQIIKSLRCCATSTSAGGGCLNCPLEQVRRKIECAELINLMGADRIQELLEENRKLQDATEGICLQKQEEMVRRAREMNTALERGLAGVNQEHLSRMLECQQLLTELGRASVIRLQPERSGEDRCLGIRVEGVTVFGEVDGDAEDG